ncbi:UDP-phosphate glycosyltransferase [Terrabacter sp. C0L_2]|uniref:UDP-phosphate glycosyltransferase n=1 Tax=Terrabacter sp. C0L_2 TaxID=3108389 RepID=UPI002ED36660|nr:UDP-phosphate glycosyltransferase [Terrabacter sp. C0L_2]
MRQVLVLLIALVVTAAAAPVVRALLLRRNILDVPNHRSSHAIPVPRAGGLACLLGLLVASGAAALLGLPVSWATLFAIVVLTGVGLTDDLRSLPPLPRLAVQALSGFLLGFALGDAWLAVAAAAIFPLVVNVVNFMDGINGISGAVLIVWGSAAWIVASSGPFALASVGVLGCVAVGTALGFLPWNVPRARLFLGDSGSYLMGALIAGGVVLGASQDASVSVLLAPLALYIGDVTVTLLRRKQRGAALMEAHREHAYQRLVSVAGLSHVAVALLVASGSAVVLMACVLLPPAGSVLVTGAAVALFLALPALMERTS